MKCGYCKETGVNIAHVRSHVAPIAEPEPEAPAAAPASGWNVGDPLPFPEGRYAILDPAEDPVAYSYVDRQDLVGPRKESVRFFKIDAPTEGKWAGFVFVKRQAGDEEHRIKHREDIEKVINRIVSDGWKTCLLLYGQKIGKCGHCGRTLTNEESRAYGIGPVCRRDPRLAHFA